MKVPLNISKLTDSPYSPRMQDAFIIEDGDLTEQIIIENQTIRNQEK